MTLLPNVRAARAWSFVAALASACCGAAPAQEGDALTLGVATHFGQSKTRLAVFQRWVRSADINSSRDDIYWAHVERTKGVYTWSFGAPVLRSAWLALGPAHHPLLILGNGNEFYESGSQPTTRQSIDAFVNYAIWATTELRSTVRMVEVWNEWNIGNAALNAPKGSGTPATYVSLARETYGALKRNDPSVTVLVGALAEDFPEWKWLKQAMALGLLKYGDALSVHLYNHCAGRSVGADEMASRLDLLRSLLDGAGYARMPVFVTEVGWPTHSGQCGTSETDAGLHSIRFLLEAAARPWVAGVWFYEFMDGGPSPAEREHRFGLLRGDGSEKPAGCMLRELGSIVASRPTALARAGGVSVAAFSRKGRNVLVAWSDKAASTTKRRIRVRTNEMVVGASALSLCQISGGMLIANTEHAALEMVVDGIRPLVIDLPSGIGGLSIEQVE